MSTIKKALIAILAALALTSGLSLVACSSGESAEDAIREDLASQFDPIKNLDDSIVDELNESLQDLDLEEYGLTTDEYIDSLLDGFDYSIDSVTVNDDGTTATASVTVTCKSFNDATETANELASEFAESGDGDDMTDDERNAKIGEIMLQAIDETEPKSTVCEFGYTQSDGTWTMDSSAEDQIYSAFFS